MSSILGKGVKKRGTSFTTINTLTRTTGSAAFDMMLPVGAKENVLDVFRKVLGWTIHLKLCISVKLAKFSVIPFFPIGKCLEFATGEMSKCLFLRGCLGRANSVDSKFQNLRRDGG